MTVPTIVVCLKGCNAVWSTNQGTDPWEAYEEHECVFVTTDERANHGTEWCYVKFDCHCAPCRQAHSKAEAGRRSRRKAPGSVRP